MTKTKKQKSIKISKLAFLDEMLEFPKLDYERSYYDRERSYSLESSAKFEELIKTIAAKTLSEEEPLAVLGNQKSEKYLEDSVTITYSI